MVSRWVYQKVELSCKVWKRDNNGKQTLLNSCHGKAENHPWRFWFLKCSTQTFVSLSFSFKAFKVYILHALRPVKRFKSPVFWVQDRVGVFLWKSSPFDVLLTVQRMWGLRRLVSRNLLVCLFYSVLKKTKHLFPKHSMHIIIHFWAEYQTADQHVCQLSVTRHFSFIHLTRLIFWRSIKFPSSFSLYNLLPFPSICGKNIWKP